MKVLSLSALRNGRLYPPGYIPGTHFYYRLSRSPGHSAAERIMSIKKSNGTKRNRTRERPNFSAMPQQTALQRIQLQFMFAF